MESLKDKLFNFDYWNVTNPDQYNITLYDLKLYQNTLTTKQLAHKSLSTDIQTLKNAFPDNKDMVKFLTVIDKKLSTISKDKVNVDFWRQERLNNTARETIDKIVRDVFDEKQDKSNKRKASLRSNDKNKLKKQKSGGEVDISMLSEVDNVLFNDNNLSVGTTIKRKAVRLFLDGSAIDSRDYKIITNACTCFIDPLKICRNGLSSILDICDITESSQKSLFKDNEWESLVKMYTEKYNIPLIPVNDLILSTWKIVVHNITNTRDIDCGLKYLYQIFPKHMKKQYFFFCLKLCEHMVNLIQMHPTMLIKADFSENDYLRIVWSNFFEYLFPSSGIVKIKTGDITYYKSTENKSQLYADLANTSKIIGFKIDLRLVFRHKNHDIDICAGEIANNDRDSKIIDDQGKLNRESKDILDNLISIIPRSKSNVSMGWSVQISGSSCFFSGIHLDADGLYVNVPKFRFTLPSTIADLDNYTDVLSKLLTFKKSIYCIADAIQESLTTKHSLERANTDETDLDSRIYWIRDSYYTPPPNKPHALPTHLFGRVPPPSILSKVLSVFHEEKNKP